MKVIILSNGRWQLEANDGTRGPVAIHSQPAFWPNSRNPDIIAHCPDVEEIGIWTVHTTVKDYSFVDESMLVNK